MRVLLTGATGFVGAYTLRVLLRERAEVMLLLREGSDVWRIRDLIKPEMIVRGDLRNFETAKAAIMKRKPEAVIHAAWAGVGNKLRNDPSQIEANVLPAVQLFRACAEAGCKHFIGIGSQAEYGPLNRKISEEDFPQPTTLYGSAKLATCVLLQQLAAQAGVRFAWLRIFSTYGPMEDPDWLIPYLTKSLLKRERPSLTACEQQWDYLHGADVGEAIWAVAREPEAKGIFNLGSGRVYTLRRIVETIRDMIDPKLPLGIGEVPYRPDQVMHLEADITRLERATGWAPRTSLGEGLRESVRWWGARQEPNA
jgi:UDP-glucose 4-epimerase